MKKLLLFLAISVATASSINAMDKLKNALSFVYSKKDSCIEFLTGNYKSTAKIIWQGNIGPHTIKTVHAAGPFESNSISYERGVSLWKEKQASFDKIMRLLDGARDIEVRLCSHRGWEMVHMGSTCILIVGNDILTATQAEIEFSLAHEISHLMLEHAPKKGKLQAKDHRFFELCRQQEKEADLNAVQMLGTADGGISNFHRLAYSWNPLQRLEMIIRQAIINFSGRKTHPYHHERIAYLKEWEQNHKRA